MSNRFPAIPDFTNNPDSMVAAMRAMKEMLEQLTGQRAGPQQGYAAKFTGGKAPTPDGKNSISSGDLWFNDATTTLYVWTGKTWKLVIA